MHERVYLVTGAASGIGAAVTRTLADPGSRIVLHTRKNDAGLRRVAEAVHAAGGRAETVLGDLRDPRTASLIVERAVAAFGRLDVVVSNAGFADRTPVACLDDAAFAASHEAICGGFFRLTRAAIPVLRQSEAGRLIAVSSFVAHAFRPGLTTFPASAAAKAGLEALVRALAIELAPERVTVNAVVPGFIRKEAGAHAALNPAQFQQQLARIPLGRLGEPDDVATAIAFLAAPQSGYITGQLLHVDGGLVI